MYFIWLILMALFIGYLAVPLMRELGYSYGRFGRWQDILVVIGGALIFGVVVIAFLSAAGTWDGSENAVLIAGGVGAFVGVILLTIFSAKAAIDEDSLPGQDDKRRSEVD